MINIDIQLKKRIMRRVYFLWFLREMLPKITFQAVALGLILAGIHEFVSAKFVLRNAVEAVTGIPTLVQFFAIAFRNTGFVPQLLFLASGLLGVLFLRDVFRAARRLKNADRLMLGASRSRA